VAVSKTHPAEAVAELLAAGQRHFGENRVQEAEDKYPALKAAYPDLQLHLIGPLQTNKVRQAVALSDVIETLDRAKLAHALAAETQRVQRFPRLLIEVNVGDEPQKAGISLADTANFLGFCQGLGLVIEGLMCIPPQGEDPMPHFRRLAMLAKELMLPTVSMGMSGDYPAAIAAGATQVRVGSALFGSRA
jgi:pyridoxal phosphate enzyme (YggS family)